MIHEAMHGICGGAGRGSLQRGVSIRGSGCSVLAATGWYQPDPLKEYKNDAAGNRIIDYGTEDEVKKWKCDCPKGFYCYDYGYPPGA